MRARFATLLGACALGACASAGGFPKSPDATPAIQQAERLIAEAQAAGADSLAAAQIAEARRHLGLAQGEQVARKTDRAALHARSAQADARYARSVALQKAAERSQAEAQSALQALPPNGGAR